ncbi:MAG TPA: DUF2071 domain-containing protein [Chloroflexaceae bacterium]|nr:DUF2071 domain-containing protein [Chloroflexaceae bacterium]
MRHAPDHRPWPRPRRPWLMAMQWHDLLFAHWPVDPAALRPHIAPPLELQTFDGRAWLAVVPFRMAGTRPRFLPATPLAGAFPELNVRTYVTAGGKPGVWFFSLDAASRLAVEAARLAFHLPYVHATMRCDPAGDGVRYASRRRPGDPRPAAFAGGYRPTGPAYTAAAGSLEHWLTERYCLYAANRRGRVWRGEVDHGPWPLQPAEAEIAHNSMAAPLGLRLDGAPLLHFARRIDVVAWGLERVA